MSDPRVNTSVLLFVAWAIALVSTLAVLFIGEVLGQTPCILCWFQRAFMFPLAIILGIAFWVSDAQIWRYALPLAAAGTAIAGYHTLLYLGVVPEAIQPCTIAGPSCSDEAMDFFDMPIPFLSLLSFGAIFVLLLQLRRNQQ